MRRCWRLSLPFRRTPNRSPGQAPESCLLRSCWTPAFAGVTLSPNRYGYFGTDPKKKRQKDSSCYSLILDFFVSLSLRGSFLFLRGERPPSFSSEASGLHCLFF